MSEQKSRTVPSKQWSCSELKDGEQNLLAIKQEQYTKTDLEDEIKEPMGNSSLVLGNYVILCL